MCRLQHGFFALSRWNTQPRIDRANPRKNEHFFQSRFSQWIHHPEPIPFDISLGATQNFASNSRWRPKSKIAAKITFRRFTLPRSVSCQGFFSGSVILNIYPLRLAWEPPRIWPKIQDGHQKPKWPPKLPQNWYFVLFVPQNVPFSESRV